MQQIPKLLDMPEIYWGKCPWRVQGSGRRSKVSFRHQCWSDTCERGRERKDGWKEEASLKYNSEKILARPNGVSRAERAHERSPMSARMACLYVPLLRSVTGWQQPAMVWSQHECCSRLAINRPPHSRFLEARSTQHAFKGTCICIFFLFLKRNHMIL